MSDLDNHEVCLVLRGNPGRDGAEHRDLGAVWRRQDLLYIPRNLRQNSGFYSSTHRANFDGYPDSYPER